MGGNRERRGPSGETTSQKSLAADKPKAISKQTRVQAPEVIKIGRRNEQGRGVKKGREAFSGSDGNLWVIPNQVFGNQKEKKKKRIAARGLCRS